MNPRPSVAEARMLTLGRLGNPVAVTYPAERDAESEAPGLVPSVCSPWEKPGPVELTRLSGLDLEKCGLLIRSSNLEPLACTTPSIKAFLSAQIYCVGTNVSFANRDELVDSGFVVFEYLRLDDLPRAGFCIGVSATEVTAIVRAHQWTS